MKKQTKYISLHVIRNMALCLAALAIWGNAKPKAALAAIQPSMVTSVKEAKEEPAVSETITLGAAADAKAITSVSMEHAGILQLTARVVSTTSNIQIELFSDESCTMAVGSSMNLSASMTEDTAVYSIRTVGTYYVRASYTTYDSQTGLGNDISLCAACYTGEDNKLKAGNTRLSYTADRDLIIYHQITVSDAGIITLKGKGYYLTTLKPSSISVTLYDSSKKPVSSQCQLYSANKYQNQYAVSKGTYYIGVCEYNPYTLRYTFQSVKETAFGSSDKNAPALSGSTITGVLANGAPADGQKWYKIKIKKETRVTITLSGTGNNKSYYSAGLYAEKNGKPREAAAKTANNNKKPVSLVKNKKLAAGTYYIAVGKGSDLSGSGFKIQVKAS